MKRWNRQAAVCKRDLVDKALRGCLSLEKEPSCARFQGRAIAVRQRGGCFCLFWPSRCSISFQYPEGEPGKREGSHRQPLNYEKGWNTPSCAVTGDGSSANRCLPFCLSKLNFIDGRNCQITIKRCWASKHISQSQTLFSLKKPQTRWFSGLSLLGRLRQGHAERTPDFSH